MLCKDAAPQTALCRHPLRSGKRQPGRGLAPTRPPPHPAAERRLAEGSLGHGRRPPPGDLTFGSGLQEPGSPRASLRSGSGLCPAGVHSRRLGRARDSGAGGGRRCCCSSRKGRGRGRATTGGVEPGRGGACAGRPVVLCLSEASSRRSQTAASGRASQQRETHPEPLEMEPRGPPEPAKRVGLRQDQTSKALVPGGGQREGRLPRRLSLQQRPGSQPARCRCRGSLLARGRFRRRWDLAQPPGFWAGLVGPVSHCGRAGDQLHK
ncbi:14-3-3 protein epsilon isoform X2 [Hemicordylus capensis]|uniref:14-3-3 protein epsilon isoform X2 n=1 Tax=Hemicordylus capensis TaxID=884348 RepID=UPI0023042278|nr:14-3-3 protein epsilon isoform X2 [Hemicordylus capensis]